MSWSVLHGYRGRKFIFGLLLLLVTGALYWFAVPSETRWLGKDGHLYNLSLGLVSGLAVLLVQFLVDNLRDKELEDLQETKIKKVLESRDKEPYYRSLIENAKSEIVVLGVTASRFLEDFADPNHPNAEKKVLLKAIERGVKVRLLCAEEEFLVNPEEKQKNARTKVLVQKLGQLDINLDLRYYKHVPVVSMVLADDEVLVGPVFSDKESRHTATIHASKKGAYGAEYVEYFEKEWINSIKS